MTDQRRSGSSGAVVAVILIVGMLVICGGVTLVGGVLLLGVVSWQAAPMPVMKAAPLPSIATPAHAPVTLQIDSAGNLRLDDEVVSQEDLPKKLAELQSQTLDLHLQVRIARDAPDGGKQIEDILRELTISYSLVE